VSRIRNSRSGWNRRLARELALAACLLALGCVSPEQDPDPTPVNRGVADDDDDEIIDPFPIFTLWQQLTVAEGGTGSGELRVHYWYVPETAWLGCVQRLTFTFGPGPGGTRCDSCDWEFVTDPNTVQEDFEFEPEANCRFDWNPSLRNIGASVLTPQGESTPNGRAGWGDALWVGVQPVTAHREDGTSLLTSESFTIEDAEELALPRMTVGEAQWLGLSEPISGSPISASLRPGEVTLFGTPQRPAAWLVTMDEEQPEDMVLHGIWRFSGGYQSL
jgi:hypothetical protein